VERKEGGSYRSSVDEVLAACNVVEGKDVLFGV
jgi:hypothetical protein